MVLMFAPGFTTDISCNDADRLRMPFHRPLVPFRKDWVNRARQIAAENAAWWLKEAESCRQIYCLRCEKKTIKRTERKFTNPALVMYECVEKYEAWMKVYNQGQLYAKDSVKPFDPAYGEGE